MPTKPQADPDRRDQSPDLPEPATDNPPWELVDAGRYRPRRTRGSCRGRELG